MESFADLFISVDKTLADKRLEVKALIIEILTENILKTNPTSHWLNTDNHDKFNRYVNLFEEQIYNSIRNSDYLKLKKLISQTN
jgi:hypothetical protein